MKDGVVWSVSLGQMVTKGELALDNDNYWEGPVRFVSEYPWSAGLAITIMTSDIKIEVRLGLPRYIQSFATHVQDQTSTQNGTMHVHVSQELYVRATYICPWVTVFYDWSLSPERDGTLHLPYFLAVYDATKRWGPEMGIRGAGS